jgi:hypothetical protein
MHNNNNNNNNKHPYAGTIESFTHIRVLLVLTDCGIGTHHHAGTGQPHCPHRPQHVPLCASVRQQVADTSWPLCPHQPRLGIHLSPSDKRGVDALAGRLTALTNL